MAISKNLIMQNLSGHLGKEIVFKRYGDKTVVTKYPDMTRRILSEKQLRVNEIMKEANYAAKTILSQDADRDAAQLRLNVTRKRLYHALVREYFKKAMEEIRSEEAANSSGPAL